MQTMLWGMCCQSKQMCKLFLIEMDTSTKVSITFFFIFLIDISKLISMRDVHVNILMALENFIIKDYNLPTLKQSPLS